MLRQRINDALKLSMRNKEKNRVSTLRLVMAAVKDRDIAERTKDNDNGISDADLLKLLQSMVKQRRDSIVQYEKGGREDLVAEEKAEIEIIQEFLPTQLTEEEMEAAIEKTIAEVEAEKIKDMGRVMSALKEQYPGQMDFGKASGIVKAKLL